MFIIARTTGVHTAVMNGNSNASVIRLCLGRNGKTERENYANSLLPFGIQKLKIVQTAGGGASPLTGVSAPGHG